MRDKNPAIAKAVCVRDAMLEAAGIERRTTKKSDDDLEADYRARAVRLGKCLSSTDAENLGWFDWWPLQHRVKFGARADLLDTCKLRAEVRLNEQEEVQTRRGVVRVHTDLISGANYFRKNPMKEADEEPASIGVGRADEYQKANGLQPGSPIICDELYRDFGPNGKRFPGLLAK